MLRALASTFLVSLISFTVFSCLDKLDNTTERISVRARDKVAILTSIGHIRTAIALAYLGTVLAFIRILRHHVPPIGLYALVTFVRYSRLVTIVFDPSGKDSLFLCKVALGLCNRVSYSAK